MPNILDIYYKRRHSDFKAYTSIGPIFTSFILQQHCHHHSHTERFKGFTRPSSCIYKSMLGTNPDVKSLTWRKKRACSPQSNSIQYTVFFTFSQRGAKKEDQDTMLGCDGKLLNPRLFLVLQSYSQIIAVSNYAQISPNGKFPFLK